MVRETRYLIVRNLPESCSEETVIDHFQRYGKIQSVKLQAAKENGGSGTATVAFNDIKSAAKAHHANNSLGEATLRTDYWEGSTQAPVPPPGGSTGGGAAGRGAASGTSYANPPSARPVSSFAGWTKGSLDEDNGSSGQDKVDSNSTTSATVGGNATPSSTTLALDKSVTSFDIPRNRARDRFSKKKFGQKFEKSGSFGRHGTSSRSLEAARSQSEAAQAAAASASGGNSSVIASSSLTSSSATNNTNTSSSSNSMSVGVTSSLLGAAASTTTSNGPLSSSSGGGLVNHPVIVLTDGKDVGSSSSVAIPNSSLSAASLPNTNNNISSRDSAKDSRSRGHSPSSSSRHSGSRHHHHRSSRHGGGGAPSSSAHRKSGAPRSRSGSIGSRSRSRSRGSRSSSSKSDSSGSSRSASPHRSYSGSVMRPQSMVGASRLVSSSDRDGHSRRGQGEDSSTGDGDRRPLGICVTGLPMRSTDSSLRDGLYHEYKKHGKVTTVQIFGEGDSRCAVVSFRKPEDASKALEASQGKTFFGAKIKVSSHEGVEVDENDRTSDVDSMDEYHLKSTRTLFVGNLEKETTTQDLIDKFKQFGEIIDVDIKRQGATTAFAFVQYIDIVSVVCALKAMEGEHIGINKIKLGFGKSMPTCCVWLDNVPSDASSRMLRNQMSRYGDISYAYLDRSRNKALICFNSYEDAQHCVSDIKLRPHFMKKKLQIDFASRECHTNFLDKMENSGQLRVSERPDDSRLHKFRLNYQDDGSPSSYGFNTSRSNTYSSTHRNNGRTSSASGSRRKSNYSDVNEENHSSSSSRRSRRGDDFNQNSSGGFYTKGDDYDAVLREYGYSQRERRERDQSPRRVDSQSRRSSRDVSLDRYDDQRSKDRTASSSLHNSRDASRDGSPSSEHNSYRSESHRYRSSRADDKYSSSRPDRYQDDLKGDDKDLYDLSHSHRSSRLGSPPYVSTSSVHSHDSDYAPRRDSRSPSPDLALLDDPYNSTSGRAFYPDDYKRSVVVTDEDIDLPYSSSRRSRDVIDLDSTSVSSKSRSLALLTNNKLGAEVAKTAAEKNRKRTHEETITDSKLLRKLEKSSTLSQLERDRARHLLGKLGSGGKSRGSPGGISSGGSQAGGSENGSAGEDLKDLHQRKQILLMQIKQLGDDGGALPGAMSDSDSPRLSSAKVKSVAVKEALRRSGRASIDAEGKVDDDRAAARADRLRRITDRRRTDGREDNTSRDEKGLGLDENSQSGVHSDSDYDSEKQLSKKRRVDVIDNKMEKRSRLGSVELSDSDEFDKKFDLSARLNSSAHEGTASCDIRSFPLGSKHSYDNVYNKKDVDLSCDNGDIFKDRLSDKDLLVINKHQTSSKSSSGYYSRKDWGRTDIRRDSSPIGCFSPVLSDGGEEGSITSSSLTEKSSKPPLSPSASPTYVKDDNSEPDLSYLKEYADMADPIDDDLDDDDDCLSDSSLAGMEPIKGPGPGEASWEERIRAIDRVLNMTPSSKIDFSLASSSSTSSLVSNKDQTVDTANLYAKYKIRKREEVGNDLLGGEAVPEQPSVIAQRVLSKKSILDQDFKRLEQVGSNNNTSLRDLPQLLLPPASSSLSSSSSTPSSLLMVKEEPLASPRLLGVKLGPLSISTSSPALSPALNPVTTTTSSCSVLQSPTTTGASMQGSAVTVSSSLSLSSSSLLSSTCTSSLLLLSSSPSTTISATGSNVRAHTTSSVCSPISSISVSNESSGPKDLSDKYNTKTSTAVTVKPSVYSSCSSSSSSSINSVSVTKLNVSESSPFLSVTSLTSSSTVTSSSHITTTASSTSALPVTVFSTASSLVSTKDSTSSYSSSISSISSSTPSSLSVPSSSFQTITSSLSSSVVPSSSNKQSTTSSISPSLTDQQPVCSVSNSTPSSPALSKTAAAAISQGPGGKTQLAPTPVPTPGQEAPNVSDPATCPHLPGEEAATANTQGLEPSTSISADLGISLWPMKSETADNNGKAGKPSALLAKPEVVTPDIESPVSVKSGTSSSDSVPLSSLDMKPCVSISEDKNFDTTGRQHVKAELSSSLIKTEVTSDAFTLEEDENLMKDVAAKSKDSTMSTILGPTKLEASLPLASSTTATTVLTVSTKEYTDKEGNISSTGLLLDGECKLETLSPNPPTSSVGTSDLPTGRSVLVNSSKPTPSSSNSSASVSASSSSLSSSSRTEKNEKKASSKSSSKAALSGRTEALFAPDVKLESSQQKISTSSSSSRDSKVKDSHKSSSSQSNSSSKSSSNDKKNAKSKDGNLGGDKKDLSSSSHKDGSEKSEKKSDAQHKSHESSSKTKESEKSKSTSKDKRDQSKDGEKGKKDEAKKKDDKKISDKREDKKGSHKDEKKGEKRDEKKDKNVEKEKSSSKQDLTKLSKSDTDLSKKDKKLKEKSKDGQSRDKAEKKILAGLSCVNKHASPEPKSSKTSENKDSKSSSKLDSGRETTKTEKEKEGSASKTDHKSSSSKHESKSKNDHKTSGKTIDSKSEGKDAKKSGTDSAQKVKKEGEKLSSDLNQKVKKEDEKEKEKGKKEVDSKSSSKKDTDKEGGKQSSSKHADKAQRQKLKEEERMKEKQRIKEQKEREEKERKEKEEKEKQKEREEREKQKEKEREEKEKLRAEREKKEREEKERKEREEKERLKREEKERQEEKEREEREKQKEKEKEEREKQKEREREEKKRKEKEEKERIKKEKEEKEKAKQKEREEKEEREKAKQKEREEKEEREKAKQKEREEKEAQKEKDRLEKEKREKEEKEKQRKEKERKEKKEKEKKKAKEEKLKKEKEAKAKKEKEEKQKKEKEEKEKAKREKSVEKDKHDEEDEKEEKKKPPPKKHKRNELAALLDSNDSFQTMFTSMYDRVKTQRNREGDTPASGRSPKASTGKKKDKKSNKMKSSVFTYGSTSDLSDDDDDISEMNESEDQKPPAPSPNKTKKTSKQVKKRPHLSSSSSSSSSCEDDDDALLSATKSKGQKKKTDIFSSDSEDDSLPPPSSKKAANKAKAKPPAPKKKKVRADSLDSQGSRDDFVKPHALSSVTETESLDDMDLSDNDIIKDSKKKKKAKTPEKRDSSVESLNKKTLKNERDSSTESTSRKPTKLEKNLKTNKTEKEGSGVSKKRKTDAKTNKHEGDYKSSSKEDTKATSEDKKKNAVEEKPDLKKGSEGGHETEKQKMKNKLFGSRNDKKVLESKNEKKKKKESDDGIVKKKKKKKYDPKEEEALVNSLITKMYDSNKEKDKKKKKAKMIIDTESDDLSLSETSLDISHDRRQSQGKEAKQREQKHDLFKEKEEETEKGKKDKQADNKPSLEPLVKNEVKQEELDKKPVQNDKKQEQPGKKQDHSDRKQDMNKKQENQNKKHDLLDKKENQNNKHDLLDKKQENQNKKHDLLDKKLDSQMKKQDLDKKEAKRQESLDKKPETLNNKKQDHHEKKHDSQSKRQDLLEHKMDVSDKKHETAERKDHPKEKNKSEDVSKVEPLADTDAERSESGKPPKKKKKKDHDKDTEKEKGNKSNKHSKIGSSTDRKSTDGHKGEEEKKSTTQKDVDEFTSFWGHPKPILIPKRLKDSKKTDEDSSKSKEGEGKSDKSKTKDDENQVKTEKMDEDKMMDSSPAAKTPDSAATPKVESDVGEDFVVPISEAETTVITENIQPASAESTSLSDPLIIEEQTPESVLGAVVSSVETNDDDDLPSLVIDEVSDNSDNKKLKKDQQLKKQKDINDRLDETIASVAMGGSSDDDSKLSPDVNLQDVIDQELKYDSKSSNEPERKSFIVSDFVFPDDKKKGDHPKDKGDTTSSVSPTKSGAEKKGFLLDEETKKRDEDLLEKLAVLCDPNVDKPVEIEDPKVREEERKKKEEEERIKKAEEEKRKVEEEKKRIEEEKKKAEEEKARREREEREASDEAARAVESLLEFQFDDDLPPLFIEPAEKEPPVETVSMSPTKDKSDVSIFSGSSIPEKVTANLDDKLLERKASDGGSGDALGLFATPSQTTPVFTSPRRNSVGLAKDKTPEPATLTSPQRQMRSPQRQPQPLQQSPQNRPMASPLHTSPQKITSPQQGAGLMQSPLLRQSPSPQRPNQSPHRVGLQSPMLSPQRSPFFKDRGFLSPGRDAVGFPQVEPHDNMPLVQQPQRRASSGLPVTPAPEHAHDPHMFPPAARRKSQEFPVEQALHSPRRNTIATPEEAATSVAHLDRRFTNVPHQVSAAGTPVSGSAPGVYMSKGGQHSALPQPVSISLDNALHDKNFQSPNRGLNMPPHQENVLLSPKRGSPGFHHKEQHSLEQSSPFQLFHNKPMEPNPEQMFPGGPMFSPGQQGKGLPPPQPDGKTGLLLDKTQPFKLGNKPQQPDIPLFRAGALDKPMNSLGKDPLFLHGKGPRPEGHPHGLLSEPPFGLGHGKPGQQEPMFSPKTQPSSPYTYPEQSYDFLSSPPHKVPPPGISSNYPQIPPVSEPAKPPNAPLGDAFSQDPLFIALSEASQRAPDREPPAPRRQDGLPPSFYQEPVPATHKPVFPPGELANPLQPQFAQQQPQQEDEKKGTRKRRRSSKKMPKEDKEAALAEQAIQEIVHSNVELIHQAFNATQAKAAAEKAGGKKPVDAYDFEAHSGHESEGSSRPPISDLHHIPMSEDSAKPLRMRNEGRGRGRGRGAGRGKRGGRGANTNVNAMPPMQDNHVDMLHRPPMHINDPFTGQRRASQDFSSQQQPPLHHPPMNSMDVLQHHPRPPPPQVPHHGLFPASQTLPFPRPPGPHGMQPGFTQFYQPPPSPAEAVSAGGMSLQDLTHKQPQQQQQSLPPVSSPFPQHPAPAVPAVSAPVTLPSQPILPPTTPQQQQQPIIPPPHTAAKMPPQIPPSPHQQTQAGQLKAPNEVLSPESGSKQDLDSSYGEAELVINLDDAPPSVEGKENQQYSPEGELPSPATPRSQRATRARKQPNYKAIAAGTAPGQPPGQVATRRAGTSPRGGRTAGGSPVVKLDRIEVAARATRGRGRRVDNEAMPPTPGEENGPTDGAASIYDFADTESDNNQSLRPPAQRRNKKRGGQGSAMDASEGDMMIPASPAGLSSNSSSMQQQPEAKSSELSLDKPIMDESSKPASSMSSLLSNVDAVIEAVAKGRFGDEEDEPASTLAESLPTTLAAAPSTSEPAISPPHTRSSRSRTMEAKKETGATVPGAPANNGDQKGEKTTFSIAEAPRFEGRDAGSAGRKGPTVPPLRIKVAHGTPKVEKEKHYVIASEHPEKPLSLTVKVAKTNENEAGRDLGLFSGLPQGDVGDATKAAGGGPIQQQQPPTSLGGPAWKPVDTKVDLPPSSNEDTPSIAAAMMATRAGGPMHPKQAAKVAAASQQEAAVKKSANQQISHQGMGPKPVMSGTPAHGPKAAWAAGHHLEQLQQANSVAAAGQEKGGLPAHLQQAQRGAMPTPDAQKHHQSPFTFPGHIPSSHGGPPPRSSFLLGPESQGHVMHYPGGKSPSLAETRIRTPPVTSAGMIYAGHPRSLSPKSASPEGQVIERLPNPMRQGEQSPSPLSLRLPGPHHQDPGRFMKGPGDDHRERAPSREMSVYQQMIETQRLHQHHLILSQEASRQTSGAGPFPPPNLPDGPGSRKGSLSSVSGSGGPNPGNPQPLNLAEQDSLVHRGPTPKSTPPAPQSPFPPMSFIEQQQRAAAANAGGAKPNDRLPATVASAFMQPSPGNPHAAHMYPPELSLAGLGPTGHHSPFPMMGRLGIDPRGIYSPGGNPAGQLRDGPPGHFAQFQQQRKPGEPGQDMGLGPHAPPAHGMLRSPSHSPSLGRPLPAELVRLAALGHELPPGAPRDSPVGILQRFPVMWQGGLALKNESSYVQMHFIAGNRRLPSQALPQPLPNGILPPLRISQRMRLEHSQLDGVAKRMQCEEDYCILIAVACGRDEHDIGHQTRALSEGFIKYLLSKQAAGIVNVPLPGSEQAGFVVHIFPPCEFVDSSVAQQGSEALMEQLRQVPHAVIIIATTFT